MEEPKRPVDLANCVYRLEILLLQVRVMVVNMHYHPVCEFDAGYVRSNTYQRVPGRRRQLAILWISTASVTSQWEYKYELLPLFGTPS